MGINEFLGRTGFLSVMDPNKKFGEKNVIFYSYPGTEKPKDEGIEAEKRPAPQEPESPKEYHIPTQKEGEKYPKEGVKKVKGLFGNKKRVETAKDEMKQYVDDVVKRWEERLGRKATDEEELLYRGYTLNQTVRDKSAAVNSMLAGLNKSYQELLALKNNVDYDMAKLAALKEDDTDAPTGKNSEQSRANFEANLPGMEKQYALIWGNLKKVETTANDLLNELEGMGNLLNSEKASYEKGRAKYEKVSSAYKSQQKRTEDDELGKWLRGTYLEPQANRGEDLATNYGRLVGLFENNLNGITIYKTLAKSVIDNSSALAETAKKNIVEIESYKGRQ
jgi:hypothetical protein